MPVLPPIQQDQYPATGDVQCLEVWIPAGDEFKALLAGLMSIASDTANYADPDSVQADGLAATWDDAYSQIIWDGCPDVPTIAKYQDYIFFPHSSMVKTNGNNFAQLANTVAQTPAWTQSAAANLDAWEQKDYYYIRKGTWKLYLQFLKGAAAGKIDLSLHEQSVGYATIVNGVDNYNATTILGELSQSFTVSHDKVARLTGTINGKNASSSGFGYFGLFGYFLRTGD